MSLIACKEDTIVVTPAQQIKGQVLSPLGVPIKGKEAALYLLAKNGLGAQYDATTTAEDGTFTLDFIRHTDVGPGYVVYLPGAYSFPLVGFAQHQQILIDLISTTLYELITASPNNCPVSTFSVSQIDAFLAEARRFVNSQIDRKLLQLNFPIDVLHKAYLNALSNDPALLSMIASAAAGNGKFFNPAAPLPPHGGSPFDVVPSIVGASPKTHSSTVNENQPLPLTVSAADYASPPDVLFYSWSIRPIKAADPVNCDNYRDAADGENIGSEVDLGAEIIQSTTDYNFTFTPTYNTAQWDQATVAYKIIARVSDGGKFSKWIWCTTVANVERAPVFSTHPVLTATEDTLWTYIPKATSPDGAPLYLKLVNYPGSPATTGPGVMDMCYDSNYGNLMANKNNYSPIWKWQNKGTPCTTPNLITWTPTNCQAGAANSVQLASIDAVGTQGIQNFSVNVVEVNTPPTFTSNPPLFPSPQAVEAIPWTYQVIADDPQADPTTFAGLITGQNSTPYTYQPGGVACADTLTYSFLANPHSATIDPHTGLIQWTPQDDETGIQSFKIQIADGHAGIATQSFFVQTQPTELPPVFVGAPTGAPLTVTVNEELYRTTPFTWGVNVSDPNLIENNFAPTFLSITSANLPPGATAASWTGSFSYAITWPLTDAQVPVAGVSYTTDLTLCDTNHTDLPWGVFAAPAVQMPGPPHDHFCVPLQVIFQADKRNFKPTFASLAPTQVIGTDTYTYNIVVTDGNTTPADTLTFQIDRTNTTPAAPVNPPAGLVLTPGVVTAPTGTAALTWTPNNTTDLGSHIIEISVSDSNAYPGAAHFSTQLFSIFVQEKNVAPTITSSCPVGAQDGTPLSYTVAGATTATTSPNRKLTYSLISGPSGMTIHPTTGVVSWNPSVAQAQVATQTFVVGVTSAGTTPAFPTVQQSCTLAMTYVTLPPVFTPMSNVTVPINQLVTATVISTDPAGNPITLSATGLPAGASYIDNGNGTGSFSWTPTTVSSQTITFNAQNTYPVNLHLSATPLVWTISAVNSPIFQSTPVLATNTSGQYSYEVHVLDPVGGGLTFNLDTAPGGMSVTTDSITHVTTVKWASSPNFTGNNHVILRATDTNNASATQDFQLNVTTGSDSGPTIVATTPSTLTTVLVSEGAPTLFSLTATQAEGYALHFAWYLDGNWIYDAGAAYNYLPGGTSAGDHTLLVVISDGTLTNTATFNIHCRDTIPVKDKFYTLPGGHLIQFGVLPTAQDIVTLQGAPTPTYSIFTESGFATGPLATATGFPFVPARMVVQNDFAQTDYLSAYFSSNGQINGAGITYSQVQSDTLSPGPCAAALCFNKVFSSAYAAFGGTRTAYKTAAVTRFNINPADRSKLSSASNGTANADVSLGAVSASSVLYDSSVNKVFVSVGPSDEILVLDPATRAISATLSLPPGSYPTAMYLNAVTKNLYVYNTGAGSLTEINAQTSAVSTTAGGLPASVSVGNDPGNILAGNDADNLLYIAVPDTGAFLTYDLNAGIFKSLQGNGASTVGFDAGTGRVFGASYGTSTVMQLK